MINNQTVFAPQAPAVLSQRFSYGELFRFYQFCSDVRSIVPTTPYGSQCESESPYIPTPKTEAGWSEISSRPLPCPLPNRLTFELVAAICNPSITRAQANAMLQRFASAAVLGRFVPRSSIEAYNISRSNLTSELNYRISTLDRSHPGLSVHEKQTLTEDLERQRLALGQVSEADVVRGMIELGCGPLESATQVARYENAFGASAMRALFEHPEFDHEMILRDESSLPYAASAFDRAGVPISSEGFNMLSEEMRAALLRDPSFAADRLMAARYDRTFLANVEPLEMQWAIELRSN